jgi:predicted glycosyltransferase
MKILIAPLDWGLGHATRCIPVISELIKQGDEVIIAADGSIESLLRKEFPEIKFIKLHGYKIKYSSFFPMSLAMLILLPQLAVKIIREHLWLKNFIHVYNTDVIISDNRFGLWNKKIHSVYITHQVMIKCPQWLRFMEPLLYRVNKFFISHYDECWIPDDVNKLSGDLSHKYPVPPNAKFIGTLSRWKEKKIPSPKKKYDIIGILSGPEPQRSSLEKLLVRELGHSEMNSLLVLGKPTEQAEQKINGKVSLVSHLDAEKMFDAISSADLVISRPGYSSIMDFLALKKNALFIPTPGQTEQEYLAGYLFDKKMFFSIAQKKFSLEQAISESKNFSVHEFKEEPDSLPSFLREWKKRLTAY